MFPVVSCTNETCELFHYLFVQKLGDIHFFMHVLLYIYAKSKFQNLY